MKSGQSCKQTDNGSSPNVKEQAPTWPELEKWSDAQTKLEKNRK